MTNNLPNAPRVIAEGKDFDIVEVEAKPTEEVKKEKATEYVTITSADNRDLEVSVGNVHFVGKSIAVPKEMYPDIKRILEEGGFYTKN